MDLTSYLSFDVKFDLTAYPTLKLTDTTAYPVGVTGQRVWYEVQQPDSINIPTTSVVYPASLITSIPLRVDENGKYLKGQYIVRMHVLHESDESIFTRLWEMTYDEVDLDLIEDVDVFTPAFLYRDRTNYAVTTYSIASQSNTWQALINGGSIGTVNASNTDDFDMLYSGNYYDALYAITFQKLLTYQHSVYSWLSVDEKYDQSINLDVYAPPSICSLILRLDAVWAKLFVHLDGCGCTSKYKCDYEFAATLLSHILTKVRHNSLSIIFTLLDTYIRNTNPYVISTLTHTNTPILPYNLTATCEGGLGVGDYILTEDGIIITQEDGTPLTPE